MIKTLQDLKIFEDKCIQPKYDVCSKLKGIPQSVSTCWFDSIMMGLIVPTNMNKLWADKLESVYGITYQVLADDTQETGVC